MTERYLLNDKLNLDEYKEEIDLFNTLKPELDKIKNIYCLEYPLWSKVLGLAGRVDCIAEYDKQLSIIDFKGSTKLKKKEHIENYFLQASAYALMWQERTSMKIKDIKIKYLSLFGYHYHLCLFTQYIYFCKHFQHISCIFRSLKELAAMHSYNMCYLSF